MQAQMLQDNIYSVKISDYKFVLLLLPYRHFPKVLLLHTALVNNFQKENPLGCRMLFRDLKLFLKLMFLAPFFLRSKLFHHLIFYLILLYVYKNSLDFYYIHRSKEHKFLQHPYLFLNIPALL